MLLQYHKITPTDSYRIFLQSVLTFEGLLLIFEFLAYSVGTCVMMKYQFHFNIKVILAYSLTAYCVDVVARITIILFEVGILNLEDQILFKESAGNLFKATNHLFITLVACSFYRIFFMVLISSIALILAIERYFATVFVSTYEKKQYKWISLLIVLCSMAGGAGGTVVFHYELINMILLVVFGLLLNVLSIVSFIFLYNTNRRNLKYCQTREMMRSYTLSLRFQLNENLKVMKWLKNCIVVVAILNIILAGFLIVSNDEYLRSNQPVLAKYFHTFLNFAIAIYGQVVIFVALLADRNYRKIFLKSNIVRAITKPFFGRIFPEDFRTRRDLSTNEETNVYFTNLSSQWDDQMRRKSVDVQKRAEEQKKKKRRKRPRWLRNRRIIPKRSTNDES